MQSDILLNLLVATAIGALIGLEAPVAPAPDRPDRPTPWWPSAPRCSPACRCWSTAAPAEPDRRPGGLGHRLSRRRGDPARRLQRARPEHRGHPLVLGGGRRAGRFRLRPAGRRGRRADPRHPPAAQPAGRWINRRALQENETEQYYRIELTCKACDEARIRALLLKGLSDQQLRLQRLESHALKDSDRVEVSATLLALERRDALLERLVGQLCLDPNVSAASWLAAPPPA